jgi:DNA-binding MarR family transcriptional regulator
MMQYLLYKYRLTALESEKKKEDLLKDLLKDLLIRISAIRQLLNGTTSDGKKAIYAPGFRIPRYVIILLAGITVPIFKEYADIDNSDCINFYRLNKIAQYLRLEFDRTKAASSIYKKLEEKGYIIIVTTQDHKTCIKLTLKGIEKCKQDLESLQTLAEYFHAHPGLQARYSEDKTEENQLYVSKGASSKYPQTDLDLTVENLITNVSNWS